MTKLLKPFHWLNGKLGGWGKLIAALLIASSCIAANYFDNVPLAVGLFMSNFIFFIDGEPARGLPFHIEHM